MKIVAVVLVAACSSKSPPPDAPPPPPKPEEPLRDAAGNNEVRTLIADLLSGKACEQAVNHFSGIKDKVRKTTVTGQMWVKTCKVTSDGPKLTIDIGGSGWQFAAKTQKKAGGTFAVNQYVKFDVTAKLSGTIDIAYANHIASLWFTPVGEPQVEFKPRGEIDVDREGVWSSIIGGAGSLIGDSPEEAAESAAKDQGKQAIKEAAQKGFEVAVDVCTNTTRMAMKRLPKGKFPKPSVGESERVAVEVQNYGAIIYGPYDAHDGMTIDVDVTGGAARVNLACQKETEELATAFLDDKVNTAKPLKAEIISGKGKLQLPKERCPVMVVLRSIQPNPVTMTFVRPQREAMAAKGGPLADCH